MWLDYLHNDDPSGDGRHGRAKAKAVTDFARLQQTVIREARKRGESDAQIIALIEECILGALLEERR